MGLKEHTSDQILRGRLLRSPPPPPRIRHWYQFEGQAGCHGNKAGPAVTKPNPLLCYRLLDIDQDADWLGRSERSSISNLTVCFSYSDNGAESLRWLPDKIKEEKSRSLNLCRLFIPSSLQMRCFFLVNFAISICCLLCSSVNCTACVLRECERVVRGNNRLGLVILIKA